MRHNTSKTIDLEPIQCVCTNIKMASRVVGRAYDSAIDSSGVNVIQYSILVNISRHEPIEQMRLAEHLNMERTTLYRAIDLLAKRKLIRTKTADKGISKLVELTPKGKEVVSEAQKKWKSLHDDFIDKFGADQLKLLNQLLKNARDHFQEL